MPKLLFQCLCPKTNLIDPQGKVVSFVGQVFRKCPLSGKPGGMAHVSQIELGCCQANDQGSARYLDCSRDLRNVGDHANACRYPHRVPSR